MFGTSKAKSKKEVEEVVNAEPPVVTVNGYEIDKLVHEKNTNDCEMVETIFEKMLDHYFISESRYTKGEFLSAITLADVYRVLCDHFDVKPEDTKYSAYNS